MFYEFLSRLTTSEATQSHPIIESVWLDTEAENVTFDGSAGAVEREKRQ